MCYNEMYSAYKNSLENNAPYLSAFPARQLFKNFDSEEDIINDILFDWTDCKYQDEVILSSLMVWKSTYTDSFPDFPYKIWKQLVHPDYWDENYRGQENIRYILKSLEMNRDKKGINQICCDLITGFIVDRHNYQLSYLCSMRNLAHDRIIQKKCKQIEWEKIDYYHLSLLLGEEMDSSVSTKTECESLIDNYHIICDRVKYEKEQKRFYKERAAEEKRKCEEAKKAEEQEKHKKDIIRLFKEGYSLADIEKKYDCPSVKETLLQDHTCNIPIRLNNDIPDVQGYEQYESTKDFIIQYRLPAWLEYSLKASPDNVPDGDVQQSNEAGKEFWGAVYQYRYFPRTLCESFFVFHEEFGAAGLDIPNEIAVLSLGCGGGGDTLGLLMALDCHANNDVNVSVDVYELNDNAFNCFTKNLESAVPHFKRLKVKTRNHFSKPVTIDNNLFNDIPRESYDFVLCSKFINEIMRDEFKSVVCNWSYAVDDTDSFHKLTKQLEELGKSFNKYHQLICKLEAILRQHGYCLILETTDKPIPKALSSFLDFKKYIQAKEHQNDYLSLQNYLRNLYLKENLDNASPKIIKNIDNDVFKEFDKQVSFLPSYLNSDAKKYIRQHRTTGLNLAFVAPWSCDRCFKMDRKEGCFTQIQFYVRNPVLLTIKDRFEGVCYRLISRRQQESRYRRGVQAIVNIKRNDKTKIFVTECCGVSQDGRIVSAFENNIQN